MAVASYVVYEEIFHFQVYAISFSIEVKFSQRHAKNINKSTRQSNHLYSNAYL